MNFEMQELVGRWGLTKQGTLVQIEHIDFGGYRVNHLEHWKVSYPLKARMIIEMHGKSYWASHAIQHKGQLYLDDIDLLDPEVVDIYMQANNIKLPERNRKL